VGAPAQDAGELAARLRDFLATRSGGRAPAIEGLRRMAGGASRELWSLDLVRDGDRLPLVLRRDPPGRVGDSSDRGLEAALLVAAAEAGVPVPRVHFACGDSAVLGSPFFLMDRVEGETIPRRLLRDAEYARAREVMTQQLGAILARIHAIDPDRPELARLARPAGAIAGVGEGSGTAREQVRRIGDAIRLLAPEPHPILELAERWLLERAPAPARRAVVHGDYRIGNVIFGPEGARAILDWELAHVGDPIEDLGWLCTKTWRFGGEPPVGGIGTREALVAAYEKAGGGPVDPAALAFWEACGSFKVALVWISQSRVFLDGRVPSVELASLGRRTAEPEAELLRILEEWA
jgi:aminoglycoside phosphotransferase (APT) family kinase protein